MYPHHTHAVSPLVAADEPIWQHYHELKFVVYNRLPLGVLYP